MVHIKNFLILRKEEKIPIITNSSFPINSEPNNLRNKLDFSPKVKVIMFFSLTCTPDRISQCNCALKFLFHISPFP